jgi:uncharacterized membrane protein
MKKSVLITERQRKRIIVENVSDRITSEIESGYELVKEVLSKSAKQYNLDVQFLLTWGATIGGIIGPLNDYIQGISHTFSDEQVCLVLTGVIASLYYDNQKVIDKIIGKIKDEGLISLFTKTLKKGKELKDVFVKLINSLNITTHKFTNIISYAFLIPILSILYDISSENFTSSDVNEIVKRIMAAGLVTISGNLLKEVVTKILKRFKA